MNNKSINNWIEWAKAFIFAIFVALFFHAFIFATSIVEGESMEPTLEDGDRLVFNKFIYFVNEPKRGDVIIIEQTNKNYVKRIIGLPGEVVELKNSVLYIDGIELEETFLGEAEIKETSTYGPITLANDSYFVMGDNRSISKDSRNGLGYIARDEIIGRSEFIFYPLDHWNITR